MIPLEVTVTGIMECTARFVSLL